MNIDNFMRPRSPDQWVAIAIIIILVLSLFVAVPIIDNIPVFYKLLISLLAVGYMRRSSAKGTELQTTFQD